MNARCHNQVSLFLTRKFISKTTNYIFKKETDRQNFLQINSEHTTSLKNSISYSKVLRVKHTCSTVENFTLYCSELKEKVY